ncbi:hypothetical protein ABTX62_19160 [Streptomyces sp. NPDC096046]|uniref:MmyB family transcriptional regulator n=1 Tax=Streptomyces sp. NPDC096046 TaxID=3155542 RepID=UPI003316BA02
MRRDRCEPRRRPPPRRSRTCACRRAAIPVTRSRGGSHRQLTRAGAEFRHLWADHLVKPCDHGVKLLRHPLAGLPTLPYETFTIPAAPERTMPTRPNRARRRRSARRCRGAGRPATRADVA